jgi:hypothetical protein
MKATLKHINQVLQKLREIGDIDMNFDIEISPALGKTNGRIVFGRYVRNEIRLKTKDRGLVQILTKGFRDTRELIFTILHEIGHHQHWIKMKEWSLTAQYIERENYADKFAAKYINLFINN